MRELKMKIVIVGGVAGGASAAARARRLSESAQIVMFERGADVSFANCGMPYYLGQEIKAREKLLVVKPSLLQARYRIDVRTRTSVEKIDRAAKQITVKNLDSGVISTESYDKLILAPGAAPFRPAWPGINHPGIFTLRNLHDMDQIMEVINSGIRRVLIVGGGFIGLELAENLVKRQLQVTLIEYNSQLLGPLDPEMAAPLAKTLTEHGVNVILNDSIDSIDRQGNTLKVNLKTAIKLETDLIVIGVGVRPENELAVQAGLEIGPRGGIKVDEHMQTADPDIYAVGDAIETRDFPTLKPIQVPLAGPANRQGRIAADHIFGRQSSFRGVQGTAIVGCFERVAAITGLSEKGLIIRKQQYRAIYLHPAHHASYYPGAEQMTIKLLFAPTDGRILGAQVIGGVGVDKRIDVLAMAIQAQMTVYDLEQAELAYAPQFGSAKDPINMAGFVAAGVLRQDHPQVTVSELQKQGLSTVQIIDVRTPEEFARGALPGAVNLPIDTLRESLSNISKQRPCVVYCQVGMRGYLATRILLQAGYQVRNLSGGYLSWDLFSQAKQLAQ
jgi:NADPH-dependent 2,4-dienoyl-CoA reductase/sulfur reductase-like enzyme/rhodanese-related sulfurtransferase